MYWKAYPVRWTLAQYAILKDFFFDSVFFFFGSVFFFFGSGFFFFDMSYSSRSMLTEIFG